MKKMILTSFLVLLTVLFIPAKSHALKPAAQFVLAVDRSLVPFDSGDLYWDGTILGNFIEPSNFQLLSYIGPRFELTPSSSIYLMTGVYILPAASYVIASAWYENCFKPFSLFAEADVYFRMTPDTGESVLAYSLLQLFVKPSKDSDTSLGIMQESFYSGKLVEMAFGPVLKVKGAMFWVAFDAPPDTPEKRVIFRFKVSQ